MESTSDDDLEVAAVLARGLNEDETEENRPEQAVQFTLTGRRTVMTNLSRGNTATVTPVDPSSQSIHQLAARGELYQLKEALSDMSDDALNEGDEHGYTPLMWSSLYNQTDVTNFLLSKNASVNVSTPAGLTALMMACCRGSIRVLDPLLSNRADVNQVDKDGNTALMYAAYLGQAECVPGLLHWGADLTLQNKHGHTAMEMSIKRKTKPVQNAIEAYLLQLLEGT